MSKVKIDVTEEPTGSEGQEEPKDVQDLTGFVSQFALALVFAWYK